MFVQSRSPKTNKIIYKLKIVPAYVNEAIPHLENVLPYTDDKNKDVNLYRIAPNIMVKITYNVSQDLS